MTEDSDVFDTYRIWSPTARTFRYIEDLTDLIDWDASQAATDAGNGCVDIRWHDLEGCITQPDTTLRAADGQPIYAGDILSFTIKGITHGPEREDIAAAHVWWCAEDGCWAFGRWTERRDRPAMGCPDGWQWWYTMSDRIDRSTIKVLGNVYQHPELLPLLGYDPFATTLASHA